MSAISDVSSNIDVWKSFEMSSYSEMPVSEKMNEESARKFADTFIANYSLPPYNRMEWNMGKIVIKWDWVGAGNSVAQKQPGWFGDINPYHYYDALVMAVIDPRTETVQVIVDVEQRPSYQPERRITDTALNP